MRPFAMETLDMPLPMPLVRQASGGPSLGHSLSRPFSGEMPSCLGPRHCGQSGAEATAGAVRAKVKARNVFSFMEQCSGR